MRFGGIGVLVFVLTSAAQSLAWGPDGHRIVSGTGASLATAQQQLFWQANKESMRQLATVPDRIWKAPATKDAEAPNHWFQGDAYVSDLKQCTDLLAFPKSYSAAVQKYGEDVILKNGTAPWRIKQLYDLAVASFKAGDVATGLQQAGAMSHYIGDLSQPLHVSENYDGQETGQTGIHKWFESTNIVDEQSTNDEVAKRAQALLNDPKFISEASGDLKDVIYHEVVRSLQERDQVLSNDQKFGRDSDQAKGVQLDLAEDRMADGAATLAVILNRLAADASLTSSASVTVDDPQWIKPDFSSQSRNFTSLYEDHSKLEDDCNAE